MDDITLQHGNCLELLKDIPDNSIDLVVTDPPYKCISGGNAKADGQPSGMLSKNDGKIFEHNDVDITEWINDIYRVLKDDTHCYIMTNTLNLEHYLTVCREAGFELHNVLCWEKNNATPSRWYMKNGEFTLFLRKGKAKPINNKDSKMIHEFSNVVGVKQHPTEKPVALMAFYIENSSNVGDTILDPFMGCGSTGVACWYTERKFIGMEIADDFFETAQERISQLGGYKL